MHDELEARTSDGVTLRIDRVRGAGERRGVVVCLHAMMTDGRYFGARRERSFTATLVAAGYDVLVADFRGHGRSIPPRARTSFARPGRSISLARAGDDDWSFDDLVERDLPAIVEAAAAASRCAARELVIVGHSLGGLVTTAALGTGRIAPPRLLLLPATSVWLLGPDGPLARRALMAAYRGVTALFGKAPIRALRAGTADEAATYIHQLTGWTRSGRWTSLSGVDYLAGLASIASPVLPLVGAGDWMCTVDDAAGFARHIPGAAPLRVIGKKHGHALDPDHFQLFTRPEMRPVWDELIERFA
jgi:pimeloyl-ACP methyl ester carboxylesterase